MVVRQIAVRIPVVDVGAELGAVEQLDEADSALDQTARHQELLAERLGGCVVQAVEFTRGVGFFGNIHCFRSAALHAIGELIGRDASGQLGAAGVERGVLFVELGQMIEACALTFGSDSGGRTQIEYRVAAGAKHSALIGCRQEAVVPVGDAGVGSAAMVIDDDEGGQVLILGAKTVGDPRADAGKAHQ